MPITSIIDTSIKTPGAFMKVSLGVGARSAGDAAVKLLLFGNKTSSGTMIVAKVYPVYSEDDVKTYAGRGSELHLMVRATLRANPAATIYIVAVAESGGTAASGTLTFTAGPA